MQAPRGGGDNTFSDLWPNISVCMYNCWVYMQDQLVCSTDRLPYVRHTTAHMFAYRQYQFLSSSTKGTQSSSMFAVTFKCITFLFLTMMPFQDQLRVKYALHCS